MELITVHQDDFVTVPAPQKQLREDIRKIETADELVRRHADVFSKDLGTLPGTVHLQIDESAKPSITPSRRVPTALREKFKAELDRLESPSESGRAHRMGKQCGDCNQEIRRSKDMHRSSQIKSSLKERNAPATYPRRLNARASASEDILHC